MSDPSLYERLGGAFGIAAVNLLGGLMALWVFTVVRIGEGNVFYEGIARESDRPRLEALERRVRHPVYGKMITRTKHVKAHDEENSAKTGDTVRIMETRPLSKDKRWRVVEIVDRAR